MKRFTELHRHPTISGRQSLTTGLQVQNVLLGSQYELMPYDGKIEVGLVADGNLVSCSIFAGPDVLAEPGSLVPTFGATETSPKFPDEYHWSDEVAAGDRLKISLFNGNAATRIVNWAIRISPA